MRRFTYVAMRTPFQPRQKVVCAICFRGCACVLLLLFCANHAAVSRAQSAINPFSARPGCPIEYQDRPRPAQAREDASYGRQPQSTNLLAEAFWEYRAAARPMPVLQVLGRPIQPSRVLNYAAKRYGILCPAVQGSLYLLVALQQLRCIATPHAVKPLCRARLMRLMAMNDAGRPGCRHGLPAPEHIIAARAPKEWPPMMA